MGKAKVNFSEKLQNVLGPFASKINRNKYILAIRDGMLAYMPFTFIASIFLIIAFFPIPAYIEFMTNTFGAGWQTRLAYVSHSSLNVGGLLVVIAVANKMADSFEVNKIQSILTAVVSFLLLTPQTPIEGEGTFLLLTRISAQAIFLAIIVGIFIVLIYKKVTDKNLKIKMPSSVPPAVSAPFESIIPSLFVIVFFWIIRLILELGFDTYAMSLINNVLGRPLIFLGGSLIGTIIVTMFEQLLWFFGLHGAAIVNSVMEPIWQVMEDQNRMASYAGDIPPNIIGMSFRLFSLIGVVGAVIAILIVAKSRQYKEVGKIAGVPYIFNIGEPTLFGIPLMLNAIYFIPFTFTRVVSTIIAYVAFTIGIVPLPTGLAQVPWTTPPIISGFLVTGSINGAILQIVLLVITTLIWIPFVKIADKQIYEKEQQPETKAMS